ncbi:MAG TPA: thioesterase [Planctomycetaceae bacterium]|nr:thioesterase [Planctomycetaceae bacterium]
MLETTILPQFSDSDALGHINYQATVRWFETGRLPIYRIFVGDFEIADRFLAMVRMEVDYAGEMRLGSEVTVRTRITEIGRSSFHVRQEAFQQGRCCSSGHVVLVHYDLTTRKAIPITDELRESLRRFSKTD